MSLWQQTVVRRDDHESAVPELRVDVLLAAFDAAAMEPNHYGRVLSVRRIIHVELTALLGIALRRVAIRDVVYLIVLRPCNSCAKQKGENEHL